MKAWFTEHKNEIIVGTIVSIVTTLIIQFGGVIITILPEAGNSVFVAINNSIYYSAGRQGPNSISSLIYSGLIGVLAGMVCYSSFWHFQRKKQIEKISNEYEELCQKVSNKLENMERKKTIQKKKKSSIVKVSFAFILIFLFIIWQFISIILPAEIWKEFELRINQIAPYVQDIEIKQLRSKWVSMHTKEDYEEINSYIIKIKEENNLK